MDDFVKTILSDRAEIVENLDKLIDYGNKFKKDKMQLSLFDSSNEAKPQMGKVIDVDFNKMIEKERDTLGVCLAYDIFDKHVLVRKRFCNNTIRTFNELTESKPSGIVLIASISNIDYRKSKADNNYAKITLQDHNSSCTVYLWGKTYQTSIGRIFKNRIYLIELGYNKDNDSAFILNIKEIESIKPEDHISTIVLHIDEFKTISKIREYVFKKMVSFKPERFKLVFNYKGDLFYPTYMITFTEENYLYLKELINDITVIK